MSNHTFIKLFFAALLVVAGVLFVVDRVNVPRVPEEATENEVPAEDQTDDGATPTPTSGEETVTGTFNQSVQALDLDIAIMPLAGVEDSRCPADVVCIQAGTVRVRALVAYPITEVEHEFTLNETAQVGGAEITLVGVTPYPYASKPILPAEYEFTWRLKKP